MFYEMSSTCPKCEMEFSRTDAMLRHKRNKHVTNHPYPQQQKPPPPPPPPPPSPLPPPMREGYALPPPQYSQSNEEEPYYILKTNNPYTFYVPDGYDPDHFMPWVHPFTSVISGPTGSGKSVFVRRFVHNIKHMMTPIPDRILWCYGEYQTLYGTVDGVDFHQGLPDLDTLDPREKHLIILDDLMDETDQRVPSLFTKKSHHRHISVMYIVQNLFHRGKHHRTISLNAHYMVVFKNPRDVSQIMALAHQMYPQRTKYFLEAYTAAIGDRISVSGTHPVHGYRSQHLQLDGRIEEQYFVDGTVEQLFGILVT